LEKSEGLLYCHRAVCLILRNVSEDLTAFAFRILVYIYILFFYLGERSSSNIANCLPEYKVPLAGRERTFTVAAGKPHVSFREE
jgi:hypothetical protein